MSNEVYPPKDKDFIVFELPSEGSQYPQLGIMNHNYKFGFSHISELRPGSQFYKCLARPMYNVPRCPMRILVSEGKIIFKFCHHNHPQIFFREE